MTTGGVEEDSSHTRRKAVYSYLLVRSPRVSVILLTSARLENTRHSTRCSLNSTLTCILYYITLFVLALPLPCPALPCPIPLLVQYLLQGTTAWQESNQSIHLLHTIYCLHQKKYSESMFSTPTVQGSTAL